jgi:hypothetical protein
LDPVLIGFKLSRYKKQPTHYPAECPACCVVNKIAIAELRTELNRVADEIQDMIDEQEQVEAEAKMERQTRTKEKSKDRPKVEEESEHSINKSRKGKNKNGSRKKVRTAKETPMARGA